ncbi:hypothetical protein L5515_011304 [Caenorhabditis briggsae]|uniref:Uncharacterized protein n=1 Tax=Caenorhabditis briggsae TaxID=6238 RepID=A0AAE9EUC6_CAEBR|nr:hypothetical protein L5515_011304 [Caenorhabditis briggsae]
MYIPSRNMQWSLCCHINVRIAYTICGILIGLFWACVYIFAWKNWVALGTCLFATSFAFETFWFYLSIKRDKILKWRPITFQILFWINLFVGFLSIGGMIAAIVLAATKHQGISNQPSDSFDIKKVKTMPDKLKIMTIVISDYLPTSHQIVDAFLPKLRSQRIENQVNPFLTSCFEINFFQSRCR